MTPLILLLVHFLVAVDGAAYPAPTIAARLDKRQGLGVATIWSPVVSGTTVLYDPFGPTSQTVTTAGNNWNWCSVSATYCYVMTTCEFGTVFYPGTSYVCASTAMCGTEYLYSTIGANLGFTRFACYDSTATANTETFLLVSPTVGPVSTTSSPPTSTSSPTSSTPSTITSTLTLPFSISPTPTSTPTSTPSPKPVGAIVGGVIGGLAVIALTVLAILLLRRRKQQPAPAQPVYAPAEVVQQQYPQQQPPPVAPYNSKYYPTSSPTTLNSPLPVYQSTMGQNEASYTSPSVPMAQELANTTDSYARHLTPSPVGTGMPAAPYRP